MTAVLLGISHRTRQMTIPRTATAGRRVNVIWFQIKVENRKVAMDVIVHGIQPSFWADRLYARQKMHTEA
jgi:hypothetical protein